MGVNKDAVKKDERISAYEGITLGEVMESYEGTVKIGTARGNGFVFCGTKEQYEYEYESLDKRMHEKNVTAYGGVKKNMKNGINHPGASVSDYMKTLVGNEGVEYENIQPTVEGYLEFLKMRFATLASRSKRVTEMRETLEKYKHVTDRLVNMAYFADTQFDPPNTLILNIEGSENGDAWTVKEYRDFIEGASDATRKDDGIIPFDSEEYDKVFGDD